jgi:hypothetical protein
MLISTTQGTMESDQLEMSVGGHENDNEIASWVEYRLAGELVHRSAAVQLKTPLFAAGVVASFG